MTNVDAATTPPNDHHCYYPGPIDKRNKEKSDDDKLSLLAVTPVAVSWTAGVD